MRSAKRLRRSLDDAFAAAGLAGACVGLYSNPAVHFDLPDETQRAKVNTLFIQEMARRGVHCLTTFKATLAHTQTDIEQTAQAATEAFQVIRRGLEDETLDSLLVCELKREPFRRLVR